VATKVETKETTELKEPKKYKVFLLNDDYTTMDFVVDVLCEVFHKTYEEAVNIMLTIHKQGKGLCGVYTYEIAETKVDQVHRLARAHEFPLRATMEEE